MRKFILKKILTFFIFFFSGTRIIYERAFLMNLKNSPLSRTPPNNVPLGLVRGQPNIPIARSHLQNNHNLHAPRRPSKIDDSQEQFEIDL